MSEQQEAHTDEHGHDKSFTIIVNTEAMVVTNKQLTYEDLVALAYPQPPAGVITYSVTYRKGEHSHEGTLVAGEDVTVKDGMIFDVFPTLES